MNTKGKLLHITIFLLCCVIVGEAAYYFYITRDILPLQTQTPPAPVIEPIDSTPVGAEFEQSIEKFKNPFIYIKEGLQFESAHAAVAFRGKLVDMTQEQVLTMRIQRNDVENTEDDITTLGFIPEHLERMYLISQPNGSPEPFDMDSLSMNDDIRVTINIDFGRPQDQLESIVIEKLYEEQTEEIQ